MILNTEAASKGVLSKMCFENMQQIYRRRPMPKCNFNKVALQDSEPCQTSTMKLFGRIFQAFQVSNILAKSFILDVITLCIIGTEFSIMLLNIYRLILETTVECKIHLTFTCGNWFFPLERNETWFDLGNLKITHFSWY